MLFSRPLAGQNAAMLVALFQVVLALCVIFLLLYGVTVFEQRILSPASLIVYSARSRVAQPEHVEVLVAAEAKRLLADLTAPGDAEPTTAVS